jgi:dihydroflavonol-4-reductase
MASKILAEAEACKASKDQQVVIVNPTTVYGPGDASLNSGTLIKKIAQSFIVPIPSGGSNVVDVDDVIEGILAAASDGLNGQRYILGGENKSFQQIFTTVSDCLNHKPKWIPLLKWLKYPMVTAATIFAAFSKSRFITPQIIEDMFAYKYYSSHLARNEIGFEPRYDFSATIDRALSWYMKEGLIQSRTISISKPIS